MESGKFIEHVVRISRKKGFNIETNRDGLAQIDFGNKKLHAQHLRRLFPEILQDGANVSRLIEKVAPGRPCTHKPMKEIIAEIGDLRCKPKSVTPAATTQAK